VWIRCQGASVPVRGAVGATLGVAAAWQCCRACFRALGLAVSVGQAVGAMEPASYWQHWTIFQ